MGIYDSSDIEFTKKSSNSSTSNLKKNGHHLYEIPNSSINNINSKRAKYGEGREAAMTRDEMGDFDLMSSEALKFLKIHFGNSLRLSELKGIINAVREYLALKGFVLPKLSRNANRNYQLCVKYVQDNFEIMKLVIPYVKLCDNHGNVIPIQES